MITGLNLVFFNSEAASQVEGPDHVRVGVDRLFSEFSQLIDGKSVALVTNHTGRLSDSTHLADVLFQYHNAELKVLFGMSI